jgi:hypothetical protein
MAIDVSDYAQTLFGGEVITSNRATDFLTQFIKVKSFEPGVPVKRFPTIGDGQGGNQTDGTDLTGLADTADASAIDVSIDTNPDIFYENIKYQDANSFGTQIPSWYASSLGRRLGERRMDDFAAFLANVATGRRGTGNVIPTSQVSSSTSTDPDDKTSTVITFDDEATGSTLSEAVGNAMSEAAIRLDIKKAPKAGRIGILFPSFFSESKKVGWVNSRDYTQNGANNGQALESHPLFGITWYSAPTIFNTNRTTGSDAKYLGNFAHYTSHHGAVWGLVFVDESVAMHEVEKPNGKILQVDHKRLYVPQAAAHKGFGCLKPSHVLALVGDISS